MNQNIAVPPHCSAPPRRRRSAYDVWAALLMICVLVSAVPAPAAELAAILVNRPQHGETLHDNSGTVSVELALHGSTLTADKRLRVFIDGNPYLADQRVLEFTLKGIERGEHHLQVQLLDDAGRVLATSLTTTFYLWQASSLSPGRKPDAKPK